MGEMPVNVRIAPIGFTSDSLHPGVKRKADTYHKEFYISPPDDWGEGSVKIDLRISSKALTIRDRRITIHKRIKPNPISNTDVIANSMG
jgi:hypothetical protein